MIRRMWITVRTLMVATALLAVFVPTASAAPIRFVFAGTITSFDARYWEGGCWGCGSSESLPDLASPGDLFIGTAYYEPELGEDGDHLGGFEVRANGHTWRGENAPFCCFGRTTLTETYLEIWSDFDLAGGGYTSWGEAGLRVSLISGTGTFWYSNDRLTWVTEDAGGAVTSFQRVPDSGSSLLLLGIGLTGLRLWRKR
jgi:hypothetical protein